MADPVYYLLFDDQGATSGSGYTPDGTLPDEAMLCSREQAQTPHAWRLLAGEIVPVPPPPFDAAAYANAKQWTLALGGYTVTVGGQALRFPTDPQSQALMIGKAVRFSQAGAPASVDWQFADGFVTLSAADFMTAAIKVADFVQATFDTLKAVLADVDRGAIVTAAAVDAAPWPLDAD
jgi:hypothetical protein